MRLRPVSCLVRRIATAAAFAAAGQALDAPAQTIGTFTWQAAPYCNVVIFTVSADGAGFRLSGFDDQCGAATRAPAAGVATPNPDGTYALSFYVVTPTGLASHTRATLSPATISGPWTDNAGLSGNLAFAVPSPVAGTPRPAPTVATFALANGAVTIDKVAANAVDSARIADGTVAAADLADNSVSSAKLQLPIVRTASSPSGLITLLNNGSGQALFGLSGGTGSAAFIGVTNETSTAPALDIPHFGLGQGIRVALSNTASAARGISVTHSGGGAALFAQSAFGNGVQALANQTSTAAILGQNLAGDGIVGLTDGGTAFGGVVGRSDGSASGVRGVSTAIGPGVLGQAGVLGGTGIAGRFENLNLTNPSDVLVVIGNGTGDLIQAQQSGNIRFRVQNNGTVTADGAFTGGGADVAEFIDATVPLAPGDVVEIDPDTPGSFRLAATASSTRVAGVITTRPGVLMNATDDRSAVTDGPALALAGRVPVNVSAENGAIAPGDLLVASSVPGHAMKAPASPAAGTVIGKALGTHASGSGRIEMLVMLR